MQSQLLFFRNLLIVLFLLVSVSGCRPHDDLPVRHGKQQIVNHFKHEKYQGLVELVDVRFMDHQLDSLYGSEFLDMLYKVTIDVKESHVVSRLYLPGGFEVNLSWPEARRTRLEEAPDNETRQQIIELYDQSTFAAGQHQFRSLITYGRVHEQWAIVEMSMDASP